MAKVRQLFNPVNVDVAQRKRICHRSRRKHAIMGGERCLVIKESDGARKNYCVECGTAILDQAERDLANLRSELKGP